MLKFKYVSQGSLKTLPSSSDPITIRSSRLNQVFQVQLCAYASTQTLCSVWNQYLPVADFLFLCWCVVPKGRVSLCGQQGGCTLGREEFLEALLLLYQECTNPDLMKIHHVAKFVNKCKNTFYTCWGFLSFLCFRLIQYCSNHISWFNWFSF